MENREIIDRLLKNDKGTQKEIYKQYNSRLFTFFKMRIKGDINYEDLVQDVFVSFFEGVLKERLKEDVLIGPYIFGIAKRLVFNYFYKQKKLEKIKQRANIEHCVSYDFAENNKIDTEDMINSLKIYIEKFKDIDKKILKDFYFRELSLDEISESTGKSKHYISVRKGRLIDKLRRKTNR